MPASSRQVTAVDSPTPRGSKPITSNCCCSAEPTAKSTLSRISPTPLEPGPPGLVSNDPIDVPDSARCRITDSSISPADGSDQSSGAVTIVHSNPPQSDQDSVCW